MSVIIPIFACPIKKILIMKYAIIAAGEGSRLNQEGVKEPKPLVRINGETLIDRLIRIFAENEAESIIVAYRESMTDVAVHLDKIKRNGINGRQVAIEYVGVDTPSSMHSLSAISDRLENSCFCLTTVDTVFNETSFKNYIACLKAAIKENIDDGVMAVTSHIDDEKPLYVATDGNKDITAFLDDKKDCNLVSAGIYGLTPKAIRILRECVANGESRMRNFQRALLRNGMNLKAFDIGTAFDIDHASDILKAERFINHTV